MSKKDSLKSLADLFKSLIIVVITAILLISIYNLETLGTFVKVVNASIIILSFPLFVTCIAYYVVLRKLEKE